MELINNLNEKSYAFAAEMVNLYKQISSEKREFTLSKQLLRSRRTSVGAIVAEANGAFSTADFSAKISLAYKETLETEYWLNLLRDTEYIEHSLAESLITQADEPSLILFSILKKTRILLH